MRRLWGYILLGVMAVGLLLSTGCYPVRQDEPAPRPAPG